MLSNLMNSLKHPNFGLLVIRLVLGGIMISFGVPKFLGGSSALSGVGKGMAVYGITFYPVFWGFIAALTETLGGFLILIGYKTRYAALFLTFLLITGTLFLYGSGGDFMKYSRPLELAAVFFGLMLIGPGRFSVDKN